MEVFLYCLLAATMLPCLELMVYAGQRPGFFGGTNKVLE